ncbi:hypothetical protein ABVT39_027882 [Epinephelus coioides]
MASSSQQLGGADSEVPSAAPSTAWATVPKKRLSLPLFLDPLGDAKPLYLINRYAPLQDHDGEGYEPPYPRTEESPIRPRGGSGVAAWTLLVRDGGAVSSSCRKRTATNTTSSRSPSPSHKRIWLCSPLAFSMPTENFNTFSPLVDSTATANEATANVANASSSLLAPPEFILIEDSIIRYVPVLNGITYSFSGATVSDLHEKILDIIECHPSAHTVIVHAGVCDIRCRQSIKLHENYKALGTMIDSLGKTCIFSGLIPSLRRSSEFFSRLYSADQWLRHFCTACGYGYISHFDSFWTDSGLYKHDKLHPNSNGVTVLASNISCHLSNLAD